MSQDHLEFDAWIRKRAREWALDEAVRQPLIEMKALEYHARVGFKITGEKPEMCEDCGPRIAAIRAEFHRVRAGK